MITDARCDVDSVSFACTHDYDRTCQTSLINVGEGSADELCSVEFGAFVVMNAGSVEATGPRATGHHLAG